MQANKSNELNVRTSSGIPTIFFKKFSQTFVYTHVNAKLGFGETHFVAKNNLNFNPLGCVSLPRPITSSEWKLLTFLYESKHMPICRF